MRRQEKEFPYLVYLLRLWPTADGEAEVWRASLQRPETGERYGFASLEALFAFLDGRTRAADEDVERR